MSNLITLIRFDLSAKVFMVELISFPDFSLNLHGVFPSKLSIHIARFQWGLSGRGNSSRVESAAHVIDRAHLMG